MAPRVALPLSRLKKRRRARQVRVVLILGGLFFALVGAAIGSTWIDTIRISVIQVAGAESLNESVIREFVKEELSGRILYIVPRDSIFLYPKEKLTKRLLAKYPTLRAVDIRADNFHTITVSIAERHPVALWCGTSPEESEACFLLDEEGVAYARAADFSGDAYYTYFGEAKPLSESGFSKQFLTPDGFHSLMALTKALAEHQKDIPLRRIAVDTHGDVRVSFANGFDVLFTLSENTGDVYERFSLALSSEPFTERPISDFAYLDLRFGDRLYYHLKNK